MILKRIIFNRIIFNRNAANLSRDLYATGTGNSLQFIVNE